MARKSPLVELEVIFQHRTEKALCVKAHETSKESIWIPLSQCEFEAKQVSRAPLRGEVVILTAPEAVLIEKGLL